MTIDTRAWLTELDAAFQGDEDRALTIHRAGQMTIAAYYRLDKVDPHEITGTYRVRTRLSREVHEYLGHTAEGWLVRAEFETARWENRFLGQKWAEYRALPYLRLVDEETGYAFPDHTCTCAPQRRATLMGVPQSDPSQAPAPPGLEDQDGADQPPT